MKNFLLVLFLNLICLTNLIAQSFTSLNGEKYSATCNETQSFRENKEILEKKEGKMIIKTKKGKIRLEDYMVEQEDPEMKMYQAVGVNNELCLALIEEVGLVQSEYLLINLKHKKLLRLNALPFISVNGNYIVSVSQPEGDDYDGFEIYRLKGDDYELIFKDNNKSYYYLQNSGKWCNNNFYIKKMESRDSVEKFYRIEF